ncbi:MAG: OmpH family outer membrane protein [Verrucomicrobiota bacterium]
MKKSLSLILVSFFVAAGLLAQKTPIMATVNVQRVLAEYAAFQSAVEKVRGSVAPVEEEIKRMQANVQNIVTEGQKAQELAANPAASEEARSEAQSTVTTLQKQLQEEQVKINQFRQQAQQLAQKGQQEDMAPLQQKALEAVKTVAIDKGIDVVVPLNGVVYADESLEITDAVIAVLNAE